MGLGATTTINSSPSNQTTHETSHEKHSQTRNEIHHETHNEIRNEIDYETSHEKQQLNHYTRLINTAGECFRLL
jgi:hypothetical protein